MLMRAQLRKKKNFKDSLKKMSIVSERFMYKVPVDEVNILKKLIKKLLQHNDDLEQTLPTLFQQLDSGHKVDISGLKDQYTQQKLYKVFKIMRLRPSKDNELEFGKKGEKEIHLFNFVRFINYVIEYVKEEGDSSQDEEDQEGDEEGEEEDEEEDEAGLLEQDDDQEGEEVAVKNGMSNLDKMKSSTFL